VTVERLRQPLPPIVIVAALPATIAPSLLQPVPSRLTVPRTAEIVAPGEFVQDDCCGVETVSVAPPEAPSTPSLRRAETGRLMAAVRTKPVSIEATRAAGR